MITQEGSESAAAWSRHGKDYLDSYLLQEVEHPALNPQSILIRAFFLDRLAPGKFGTLIDEELYFSACACFALLGQREGWFAQLYARLLEGDGENDLPEFLRSDFHRRHASRFTIRELFDELAKCLTLGFEFFESPFRAPWREACQNGPFERAASPPSLRALELACGSANDYRYFDDYALAPHLDYTGIDVCPENIENARRRFPEVTFEVDDAAQLDAEDDEYDIVLAFDLFEHLSPVALDAAFDEAVRVCQGELWLSFFNLTQAPVHSFSQEGSYYWNALSLLEVSESLKRNGCESIDVISVKAELESRFPDYRHYNEDAYLLVANVEGSAS